MARFSVLQGRLQNGQFVFFSSAGRSRISRLRRTRASYRVLLRTQTCSGCLAKLGVLGGPDARERFESGG